MSRDLVVGLDLGTTACKAVALARDGSVAGTAAAEYPLHAPKPGWAEQDVHEIWRGACAALKDLTATVDRDRLAGLALSGAMHCIMPIDDAGEPLARAITWADNRAVGAAARLRDDPATVAFYSRTGCPVQWLYLPAKLQWLAEHQRDMFLRAAMFVSIKDWVLHRLAGAWACDICFASGSGLVDLHTRDWHGAALSAAGIEAGRLPPLVEPQKVIGQITQAAADETGLPRGLPVMPGGGDGGLANIGAGAAAGGAVVSVGTSGAVRVTANRPLLDAGQRTWCYILTHDRWYAGGAINSGGLAVDTVRRWVYGDMSKEDGFDQLFADADGAPPGCDGVTLLPYFAGERNPHWRPDLTASLHGMNHSHGRSHIARAALEGVAFCLADVWQVMREQVTRESPSGDQPAAGGPDPAAICLTGGITHSRVWSQIVCDVLGAPLRLSEIADASALGAAAIGHWGLGHVRSLADQPITARELATLTPHDDRHALYRGKHLQFQKRGREVMESRPA